MTAPLRRFAAIVALSAAACGANGGADTPAPERSGGEVPGPDLPTTVTSQTAEGPVDLNVTDVATGLDTVWSMAFDRDGHLWYTERLGRVTRLGDKPQTVPGVVETGEAGLMGLAFDGSGRRYLAYTSATDNRVVRSDPDGGSPAVLVSGIKKAAVHDGGRLAFGPDGALYVATGDAADPDLAQDDNSLNGKILRIDVATGAVEKWSKGHRNVQGLCFAPDGRFLATEHGPERGDEINDLHRGDNGGWPQQTGNGIKNYTPTIAPAGCAVYDAALIPQWKGSMLFVTLKERDLRRLTFAPDGSVETEEILFDGAYGRLRDVVVAPDGAVYLATSNRDGRGDPKPGDDRILRLAPK